MMREAAKCGHDNFMIAGIQPGSDVELHGVSSEQCRFVRFNGGDISFPIPGMTDIMPYPSTRFVDLSERDIETYEWVFSCVLIETVSRFRPDIIHSHHNWLLSSLVRRLFPNVPVVTTCHGTDLRQFQNCPHLHEKVLSGCRHLDAAMVLTGDQKASIEKHYRLPPEKLIVTGAGYNDSLFTAGAGNHHFFRRQSVVFLKGLLLIPATVRATSQVAAPAQYLFVKRGQFWKSHDRFHDNGHDGYTWERRRAS